MCSGITENSLDSWHLISRFTAKGTDYHTKLELCCQNWNFVLGLN